MKSPFKVMSTAALAAAVAVPTLSVPAADAAETSSFQSVALETEDGSIVTVSFSAYAQAKTFGTGELGEFVESADVVAVSAEEGKFVTIRTLAMAKIDNPDADTVSLLDELDESEDNLVADEEVVDYTAWEDMGEDATPVVESVSANNLKVVTVDLNSKVNLDTATAKTVKVLDANGDQLSASYQAGDENTLDIVLDSDVSQSTDVKVVVDGLETDSGETFEKYEEELTIADTELPTLDDAKILNGKQVKLFFSEPVNFSKTSFQTLNNVKIDGTPVIAKANPNFADDTVTLELPSVLEAGTHTITVGGVSDFADYKIMEQSFDVFLEEDEEAPTLETAEMLNKDTIRVTFDEKVESEGSFQVNNTSISSSDVTEVAGSNGTQFDVNYTLDLSAVVETKVEYKGQTDVVGNKVDEWKTVSFEVQDDTSLPSVTSELGSNNKLTLDFSKTMNTSAGTITVLNADEDAVAELSVNSSMFKADTNNTVIELTASDLNLGSVNPGEYTVVIEGMKDATIRENLLPKEAFTINAEDTQRPSVEQYYSTTNGDDSTDPADDTVTFYFNEAMDADTLSNLSNYVNNASGDAFSAIDGVELANIAADGKSVTFTYPNAANLGTTQFTVYALKDVAGNMVTTNKTVANITTTGNGTVAATGATATSNNTVEVQFNSSIQSVDPSAVTIEKLDGTPIANPINAQVKSSDNTKVVFTLNEELDTNADQYKVVANNDQLISNVYGDRFGTTTADSFQAQVLTDEVSPELASVTAGSGQGDIDVNFTEAVAYDADLTYDLKVMDLTDEVELLPSDYTLTNNGDKVTVNVTKAGVVDHEFSVELLNNRYITDDIDGDKVVDANENHANVFDATTVVDASGDAALITSSSVDMTQPTISTTTHSTETKSSTTVDFDSDSTADLTLTSTAYGSNGDGLVVDFVNDVDNASSTVSYSNGTVTVELGDDGSGGTAGTVNVDATEVQNAINNDATVSSEVTASSGNATTAVVTSATTAGGADEEVVITFSEAMDTTSVTSASDLTVGTESLGTAPAFGFSSSDQVLTVTLDSDNTVSNGDSVTGTNATDVAGNSVDLSSSSDLLID